MNKKKRKTKKNTLKISKKTLKRVCAPKSKHLSIQKNSCMTPYILHDIKKLHNNNNSSKITSNNALQIFNELKNKFSDCQDESCILHNSLPKRQANIIEKELFAPKHPPEWKDKPNTWLSNFDIEGILSQYEDYKNDFEFMGPSFIDFENTPNGRTCVDTEICQLDINKFKSLGKNKIGIVFNLDKHYQNGSHWVSMFIDIKDKFIFYFDSAGDKIPKEFMRLVKKIKQQGSENNMDFEFHQVYPFQHQYGDNECGMYCLFFIISLLTEKHNDIPFNGKEDKIQFIKKKRIPDRDMHLLRKQYFNSY